MAEDSFQEGTVPFFVESISKRCQTYYRIYGDLNSNVTPLIVLHGGPGAGYWYMMPFKRLWSLYGIPVILYDQIGCCASTHIPEKKGDRAFWSMDLFVAELNNLIDHLGLRSGDKPGYHVYGHSYGGRVSMSFAVRRPSGLRRLIVASASVNGRYFVDGLWQLLKQLSPQAQKGIEEGVAADDFTSPEYQAGIAEFYKTFLCRADPWPPEELATSLKLSSEDETVRETIIGPSPFKYGSAMSEYNIAPQLSKINVPTLMYNAEFDTNQTRSMIGLFEQVPKIRWFTFQNASHMVHLDSPEMQAKVLKLVGEFLTLPEEVKDTALEVPTG